MSQAALDLMLRCVVETLQRYRYRFSSEVSLHDGMAQALTEGRIAFKREFVAGPQDRFDFLVEPGIVIEAKIKGSLSTALHQVDRYAARDDVRAIVIATTRFWSGTLVQNPTLRGKPLRAVKLNGASF